MLSTLLRFEMLRLRIHLVDEVADVVEYQPNALLNVQLS